MRAGVSGIDITPAGSVWMDGMIRTHRSEGVHDRLRACALVLAGDESLDDAVALVSVDVCTLTTGDVHKAKAEVTAQTGILADRVIIAATHTHSGPATVGYFNPAESDYTSDLISKIVRIVREAAGNLRPAAAACGSGRENTISHYRRLLADDGHVVMNWEPYPAEHIVGPLGEPDPEVGALKIVRANDPSELICVLFNHAGHPNVMSGDNYLLSGDYPGEAARLLEERFGTAALFFNGAQGTVDIDGLKDRDWEGVDRIGRALADAVAGIVEGLHPDRESGIRIASVNYLLPARQITPDELSWADEVISCSGGEVQALPDGVGDDYKANLYKRLYLQQNEDIPAEQVCFAIGDTAFISFPGELYTEIGMHIKATSPFKHTYILGLANGTVGYVPTRKAIAEGGYAEDTRYVDASAEDVVVQQSLALLNKVFRCTSEGENSQEKEREERA